MSDIKDFIMKLKDGETIEFCADKQTLKDIMQHMAHNKIMRIGENIVDSKYIMYVKKKSKLL